MKKVLLIGDSIRLGYQPFVTELLEGTADVVGPDENCRFAKYTLWSIDEWITQYGTPDIVHWNNGIWDIYNISEEHGIFTPIEEYVTTIRRVLSRLKKTGAPIIWATTTAVHSKNLQCKNEEIDLYNEAIVELMKSESVTINDLNKLIKENIDDYIDEDLLHLTKQGNKVCADAVVKVVMKFI